MAAEEQEIQIRTRSNVFAAARNYLHMRPSHESSARVNRENLWGEAAVSEPTICKLRKIPFFETGIIL